MCIKRNLMIGLLIWAVFGATNAFAQAHEHGHHSHHQMQMTSPFDKDRLTQSLHCQLKGHANLGFCPHSLSGKDKSTSFSISPDCGGTPIGSTTSTQFSSNDLAETIFLLPLPHTPEYILVLSKTFPFHRYSDSLDPPPRII
jgi:hypothetical protein